MDRIPAFSIQALIWFMTGSFIRKNDFFTECILVFSSPKTVNLTKCYQAISCFKVPPCFITSFRRLIVEPVCPVYTSDVLGYHAHVTWFFGFTKMLFI